MDWLQVFKSKTYGKLRFSVYIFSLLIILYVVSILVSSYVYRNISLEAVGALSIFVLTWWFLQVPISVALYIAKKITSILSPFSRILYLLPNASLSNLIWHGDVRVIDSVNLHVSQSDRGLLFKNVYWKDFVAYFSFKFGEPFPVRRNLSGVERKKSPKENFLGFIFRAQDLDNYFMLQLGLEIDKVGKRTIFFRPHVRINGNWEATTHRFTTCPYYDDFNKVKCVVKGMKLTLELNDKVLSEWDLPTHSSKKIEGGENTHIFGDSSLITFRDDYGMVGFRASQGENAIIKDIKMVQV